MHRQRGFMRKLQGREGMAALILLLPAACTRIPCGARGYREADVLTSGNDWRLLPFAVLLFGAASLYAEPTPSFDCAKTSERSEDIICGSAALARQDVELNTLYKRVMEKLTPDVQEQLRQEQRAWLKDRERACKLYYPAGRHQP